MKEKVKNLRCLLVFVSLCAVLIIGPTGCGVFLDDNEWGGRWALNTVNGKGLNGYADSIHDKGDWESLGWLLGEYSPYYYYYLWTFDDDGMWYAEMRFKANGQVISFEATGTYSLSDSNYTITGNGTIAGKSTITRKRGKFIKFIEVVVPADVNTGFPAGENISSFANIGTGTWSEREGILTLSSDAGHVLTFVRLEQ